MNWGTKLTVGMILFMGFIVTLVTLMIKPHKTDSLIDNDYYEKGQTFDLDYNASRDAVQDQMIPVVRAEDKGVSIVFVRPVSYEIQFRNLANSSFDRTFKSESALKEIFIPANELKSGSWLLRIQYKADHKDYLYQNKVLLP